MARNPVSACCVCPLQAGWRVVSVPYYEWMELEGRQQKQQYLADQLQAARVDAAALSAARAPPSGQPARDSATHSGMSHADGMHRGGVSISVFQGRSAVPRFW